MRTQVKEREKAEEALRESQKSLHLSYDHVNDLISQREQAEEALRESHNLLRRKHEELRSLTARLLTAHEEEGKRVARELHDDLIQKLAVLAIRIEWLEHHLPDSPQLTREQLRSLSRRVAEVTADVRRMARQLHPSILEDLGLAAAIQSYANHFAKRERVTVKFTARDLPESLSQDISLCLYRVAQESLSNVAKHARTKEAAITVASSQDGVSLSVKDAGVGFNPGSVTGKGGLGLISMQERVRLVNGNLSVSSRRGSGTEVSVWIPLNGGSG
jgi:signal transduction histidine kinase